VVAQTRAGMQGTLILLAVLSFLGLSALTIVFGRLRRTSAVVEQQVVERTAELRRLAEDQRAQLEERKRLHEALARQAEALATQRLAALNIAQDEEEARKRAERDEQRLAQVNQELVREIDQRQRAEAELQQTAAELARSNRELELFASVASHDLQEPLRMVSSYLELLSQRYRGQLDERADRWINFAVDGAVRMKQLINDLLEFSRVGTRGKPFETTDCAQVFARATLNLQRTIEERGAEVTSGPLPTLMADGGQLTQLLQNLIGNGIKFCKSGRPVVRVEAELRDGFWRFSVRDNGIGIDPQFAERIFVIFQRLHSREEYAGTGIGLAVCKKIVERHGGTIWVESQPGQGSTFYFTLPERQEGKDNTPET
jgi:light-regulated signal transduction histidine kinase (bacteriophytochrome)